MMILLTRGHAGFMFITATEKIVTLPAVYNITFTAGIEHKSVSIDNATDLSPFPDRYNKFSIDPTLFNALDNGFYIYQVTDDDGNILEVGKMKLIGDAPVSIQYQDAPTEYITYGK
jgi:hypothetical protein